MIEYAMPNNELLQVRDAPLTRLVELAPVALAASSQQRAGIVLSVLEDLVRQDMRENLFLSETTRAGKTVAAAIAARTASDSASLLALGAAAGEMPAGDRRSHADVLDRLLRHLHRRLADAGVTFVQAMREPETEAPELARSGYMPLATLDYLLADRRESRPANGQPPTANTWRFVPFEDFYGGQRPREQLVRLIETTYAGSLDCPKIGELRSAPAVIESYCQSSAHDPHCWQILSDAQGRELGCLLTTPYRQSGSLEITYMGLVPEARRRGYGAALIDRSWRIADACGLIQLTVAVDQQNKPARGLYRRHGFEVLMSEAVWGRSIAVEAETGKENEIAVARGITE